MSPEMSPEMSPDTTQELTALASPAGSVKEPSRGGRAALALAAVLTLLGSTLVVASLTGFRFSPPPAAPAVAPRVTSAPSAESDPTSTPRSTASSSPSTSSSPTARPRRQAKAPIVPVRIEIPGIGTDAPVTPVALDRNKALQVPHPDKAGWWRQGAKPGARGVAVVVGHLDSKSGPAVFHRLPRVRKGAIVVLSAANGTVVRYRVDAVHRYAKNAFPTRKVYGATKNAQLRLITCGGAYDRTNGGYQDNVVVFATLVR